MKYIKIFRDVMLGLLFAAVCLPSLALASETVGTILPGYNFSKVCQDVTCTNFGVVNFLPTLNSMTPGAAPVTITDISVTGHAWGNQIGWINLAPTGLTSVQTLKVNPNTGVITGLGFASTGSWVNFSPVSGGVTINSVGEFVGFAWVSGAYGGWMKFDCSSGATCIKTDWRTISNRTVVVPPGGGGGGGGGGGPIGVIPTPPLPFPPVAPATPGVPNTPGRPNSPVTPVPTKPRNTFDPSGTGTAEQGPATIVDTTKNVPAGVTAETVNASDDGEYRQTFPRRKDVFTSQKDCFWCIIIRRDFAPSKEITTGPDGKPVTSGILIKERRIIKYGFVPKKYEIRIPLSKLGKPVAAGLPPRTDLDLTSTVITLLVLGLIRKLIAVVFVK